VTIPSSFVRPLCVDSIQQSLHARQPRQYPPDGFVDPLLGVLRALVAHGGSFVDTWPRNAQNDAGFGRVAALPEFRDKLFVTTKIDQVGKDVGERQFRDALRNYQREVIDLVQIFSLTDLDTHWPSLKEWKAEGAARYIGVTVSQDSRHADLEQFLRRERPDFVQVNYSITERAVEDRLLPFAAERGVAVVINRPFMNGAYFDRLERAAVAHRVDANAVF